MDNIRAFSHDEFKHCLIAAGLRVAVVGGCDGENGGWLGLVYRGSHSFWVTSLATAPVSGGCGLSSTSACPAGCRRNLVTGEQEHLAVAGRCLSSLELSPAGALKFVRSRRSLLKHEAVLAEWIKNGGDCGE